DDFYWHPYSPGHEGLPIRVEFPGLDERVPQPPEATVRFFGASDASGVKPSHKFIITYGKTDLGLMQFDGIRLYDVWTTVPRSPGVRSTPPRTSRRGPERPPSRTSIPPPRCSSSTTRASSAPRRRSSSTAVRAACASPASAPPTFSTPSTTASSATRRSRRGC